MVHYALCKIDYESLRKYSDKPPDLLVDKSCFFKYKFRNTKGRTKFCTVLHP